MPEGGVLKSKDRALGTYLKCHHTGLGVKGVPCHVVLTDPVDIVDSAQNKRIFLPLKMSFSARPLFGHKTSKMKMLSKTVMSLWVYAASLLD